MSILICSVLKRKEVFLKPLLKMFTEQLGSFTEKTSDFDSYRLTRRSYKAVEILICIDNQQMTVGKKRNLLKSKAHGQYGAFFDDDDVPDKYYCACLLEGIKSKKDVINFFVYFNSAHKKKIVEYGLKLKDSERHDKFLRASNHLMCIKTDILKKLDFKEVNFGEDADFAKRLKNFAKTEAIIPRVLYYYNFSHQTSLTQ